MSSTRLWSGSVSDWEGKFGDEYSKRNRAYPDRKKFWGGLLQRYDLERILEVGCNIGFNLIPIGNLFPRTETWGVDINRSALKKLRITTPEIHCGYGDLFDLPFKDRYFDLTFTCGVLIHIHPNNLQYALQELERVAHGYLLIMEYHNNDFEQIPYRDNVLLFKGPYGKVAEDFFGKPVDTGFLSKKDGFDDVTYWLFDV